MKKSHKTAQDFIERKERMLEQMPQELQDFYKEERDAFLENYPYLNEVAMFDLLHESIMIKIQIKVLTDQWLSNEDSRDASTEKRLDSLRRTLALLYNRMGISYVSKERKKDKVALVSPLELLRTPQKTTHSLFKRHTRKVSKNPTLKVQKDYP